MKELVEKLLKSDQAFAEQNDQYNALDTEIRELELDDAPIADDPMHELKRKRAELMDQLYQALVTASSAD